MLNQVTSVLLCIAATATTYLGMHFLVGPRLAGHAPTAEVPAVAGLTVEQARAQLDPRGLLLVLDGERETERVPAGALFEQRPLGGSRLHTGEQVHALVALAPRKVPVPALLGQSVEAARRTLEELGLKAGAVTQVASATVAAGLIEKTQPPPGAEARPGAAVDLIVSRGLEQTTVPSLRGRSAGTAKQLLEQAGLVLGERKKGVDDDAADGVVIRQTPAAGTEVAKGQKVDIVVNE